MDRIISMLIVISGPYYFMLSDKRLCPAKQPCYEQEQHSAHDGYEQAG